MPLTTEQKINLLILAGFEPYENVDGDDGKYPRIVKALGHGHITLWRNRRASWSLSNDVRFDRNKPATWDSLGVGTIPQYLIYQAIGAAS